ncbi:MAG: ABC transporter ATP-binding protein [Pseudobdellovibrionaceae bacterium]
MLQETDEKRKNAKVSFADIRRYTLHYWGRHRRFWPFLILGMVITGMTDAVFPYVVGRLIDALSKADVAAREIPAEVAFFFAALIGVELFYHVVNKSTFYLWNIQACRVLRDILQDAFQKVQGFSTDWHANSFAGATVRKLTRGMWAFDMYEDILFTYFLPTFVVITGIVGLMIWHWPVMGLVTAGVIALYIAINIAMIVKINQPRFRISAQADTDNGAFMADAITSNASVKSFASEAREEEQFKGMMSRWYVKALTSWQWANTTDLIRRFMTVGIMVVMLAMALYLWKQGQASTGDVVYIFTNFIVLTNYLRTVGEQTGQLLRLISDMEDIVAFWKAPVDLTDRDDAVELKAEKGRISFDAVTFAYGHQGNPIYEDFSLEIASGEKVALVGHSGSGKSTFVKLLQRLYDVQGGAIRIDGQEIAGVTLASLRKSIALVPQEPALFHRTLRENIAYGRPDATEGEIIRAAKKAYAHDFITRLPLGYDTLVGERGVKLSGGERQRIAIARAILADCPILILDEATSALDSVSEHQIQKALASLMEGRTTITIAHRLATIKSVDRILVFDQGRIIEQGHHTDLIAREGSVYKNLYEMQALDLIGAE